MSREPHTTVWGDILHPESLRAYGVTLETRARNAKLFLTGLDEWDRACDDTGGGLDEFWYVVVGGASNVGKTQLAISLAIRGLHQGFAVVFLTMEEPCDQIQRRVYAAISPTHNYYDFTYRNWTVDKARLLVENVPYIGKFVVNDDLENESVGHILAYLDEARDALVGRPMIVLVDNLQLVKTPQGTSVAEAATSVSEGLRKWAKRNRTLVVALSQVTAQALRERKPVRSHDLWGGSSMYSNPSQVLMLDHTAACMDDKHHHLKRLWLLLDKNRYGPKGVAFPVEANMKTGTWRTALPDEHGLWLPNPWESK